MILGCAKDLARQWVMEHGAALPGFRGAFFHGSTAWLPDTAVLPPSSEVDMMVVLEDPGPPDKLGKFLYKDLLLEVSYLPSDQLPSPEVVLAQYHLAGSLRTASVILDPSGWLTELQAVVSRDYAKRYWVRRRCEHARDKVLRGLQHLNAADPFHDQVLIWLFPTGVTTHVLLTAGLRNPTVRQRYVAVGELLREYGHSDLYEELLALLGCTRMSSTRGEHHLTALAEVFDVAKDVGKTPFPFSSDITDVARPIAIDGSQDLIRRGLHREAVFWIVATYSRCQKVLHHDAPLDMKERFDPGYRELLGDLGILSLSDLEQRREQVEACLPRVWEAAEAIMADNPEIAD